MKDDVLNKKNEEGSVLIISLIMIVLLTLLGITATRTSTIEVQIATNDKFYKQNLCVADGTVMECVQTLENAGPAVKEMTIGRDPWIMDDVDNDNIGICVSGVTVSSNMTNAAARDDTNWPVACIQASLDPNNSEFMAFYGGVVPGSSLDMTKPTIHGFSVFGRSQRNNGRVVVGVGYRKAI